MLFRSLAHGFVDMVFFVAQDALAPGDLGEFLLRLFVGEVEMFCQPYDVSSGDLDAVITAAVAGAFRAVEKDSQGSLVIGDRRRHQIPLPALVGALAIPGALYTGFEKWTKD